jgi:hypothetical protein
VGFDEVYDASDAPWRQPEALENTVISMAMKITHASHLSNDDLVTEVTRLARGEREATVALIVHLAEFDARRLFEGAGFSSTFKYCMEVLRLSEDATFNRIEAARAARRYPAVLDMLVAGTLSPTTARMLARHLTAESHEGLLAAASGMSKQEVERLLVRLSPRPEVPPSIRAVRSTGPRAVPMDVPMTTLLPSPPSAAPIAAAAPTARPVVRPLSAEHYEIRFTATTETRDKLRRAQDLLGHAVRSGDLAEVFDRALTLLVADLERKKFAATARPRGSRGQSDDSRNVPADVRRVVVARDGGRCAFVASSGRRCGETRAIEFHHLQPYGARGEPTVDNIQLRCRAHNRYEAELFYGPSRCCRAGDVVSESLTVWGHITATPPVPERVGGDACRNPARTLAVRLGAP